MTGASILFLGWIAFIAQASWLVGSGTALGTARPVLAAGASAFDVLPGAPSGITRLIRQTGLSDTPRVSPFASLMFEPFPDDPIPDLTATFRKACSVTPQPACCEHGIACDRSPPTRSLAS
jgi:hypothetical protein